MKKLVMSLVVALAAFCSWADTEEVGGVKWSYYPTWDDSEGGYVAVVTGASPTSGALDIPSELGGYPVRVIGDRAFMDCNDLTSVAIPSSVKVIGEKAFWFCHALANVNLAEGIEVLGKEAFLGCLDLGNVSIPSTIEEIGAGCLAYAYKMNSVSVDEGNQYFKSIDGVVYSKDGTRLVWFPAGRTGEWTVPEHVTEIGGFS